MSVRNKKELRDRLILRNAQLDFSRLAKDLEPVVYSKKEVDRVRMFPEFIRQAIWDGPSLIASGCLRSASFMVIGFRQIGSRLIVRIRRCESVTNFL